MQISGNIFLVGLMGAGKTTVGKLLAKHLNKSFCDSDHEIERRTGVNIPLIFDIEGETGFRSRESAVILDLAQKQDIVLATGGGAILDASNREALRQQGIVVYLCASVEDLWLRTRHDRNRPLLQTADPRAKLVELFEQRHPLYRETAHIIIDTSKQSVQNLVHRLEEKLVSFADPLAQSMEK